MKLRQVFEEKKDKRLCSIESGSSICDAAKKFVSLRSSYLMVTEKGSIPVRFIGILTKNDILRAFVQKNADPEKETVDNFMTRSMIVAAMDDDVSYIMNVMLRHDIGYIPVIDGKNIAGVITRSDIIESQNIQQDIELRWLSDYSGVSAKNTVY